MSTVFAQTATHWIGGDWHEDGDQYPSFNPATGEALGQFHAGSVSLTDQAVTAARRAFEDSPWGASPKLRAQVLLELAQRILADKDTLIALLCLENGKTRMEATFEIMTSVAECRYYAGLATSLYGRVIEVEPGVTSTLAREPAGVAAIIVPWNAPIILMIRSLAPALAAGCAAVVKPAPQTPLAHFRVLEHLAAIEALPTGIINSINENGAEVGKRLVASDDVDVISFTGSSATGKAIMASAAPTLKRLSLELGGKAPALIFDDSDLDHTLPQIVRWSLVMGGQMCIAITRILVQDTIYDAVEKQLSEAFANIRLGSGINPETQMGPLIDRPNQSRVLDLVDQAADTGELVLRGRVPEGDLAAGCFLSPSLLRVADLESPFIQEEVFGPLLCIERFSDEADAVRRANATRYGLASSVWTRDLGRASRVSRALRAGTVWLNAHGRLLPEAETGGYGQSGLGRLHGIEALNDFLETKHIYQEAGGVVPSGL